MDIIQSCLSLAPVPYLSVAFSVFTFIWTTVEQVKASKSQLRALAHSMAQLLQTLDKEYRAGRLLKANTSVPLDNLGRLLEEIKFFVHKQATCPLAKLILTKDERISAIDEYHRRIYTAVNSFQISALLDIQHWQSSNEEARVRDQEALNDRLNDLEKNQSQLMEELDVHQNNVMAMLVSFQRRFDQRSGDEQERRFLSHSIQLLSTRSGSQVKQEDWMITSLDVDFGQEIGSGGFGKVYKGSWHKMEVALKVLKLERGAAPSSKAIRNEVGTWQKIRHPHILQFLGANVLDDKPFIVMPYLKNGNARDYVQNHRDCDQLKILHDVCLGLVYLHAQNVIHGDIKAVNILIDDSGKALLCDFGLSRVKADALSSTVVSDGHGITGSRQWMAPEQLMGKSPRKPCDIYALGMTIYEIYALDTPLIHINYNDFVDLVVNKDVRPERPDPIDAPGLSDELWELTQQCWMKEPDRRPNANSVCDTVSHLHDADTAESTSLRTRSSYQTNIPSPSPYSDMQPLPPTTAKARDAPPVMPSNPAQNPPHLSANHSVPLHPHGAQTQSASPPDIPLLLLQPADPSPHDSSAREITSNAETRVASHTVTDIPLSPLQLLKSFPHFPSPSANPSIPDHATDITAKPPSLPERPSDPAPQLPSPPSFSSSQFVDSPGTQSFSQNYRTPNPPNPSSYFPSSTNPFRPHFADSSGPKKDSETGLAAHLLQRDTSPQNDPPLKTTGNPKPREDPRTDIPVQPPQYLEPSSHSSSTSSSPSKPVGSTKAQGPPRTNSPPDPSSHLPSPPISPMSSLSANSAKNTVPLADFSSSPPHPVNRSSYFLSPPLDPPTSKPADNAKEQSAVRTEFPFSPRQPVNFFPDLPSPPTTPPESRFASISTNQPASRADIPTSPPDPSPHIQPPVTHPPRPDSNGNPIHHVLQKPKREIGNWTRLAPTPHVIHHTSSIHSIAFSPDGQQIALGDSDGTVQVWDATAGNCVSSSRGHAGLVHSVAFSPSGRTIASGSFDHTVRIWDAQTGECVSGPLKGHTDKVLSTAFSPDGKLVASGSSDKTIRVWDVKTGRCVSPPFEEHTSWVRSVAFSPDGRWIASGSADMTIRLWDTTTGRCVSMPFEGHTGWVRSVAFSPNGQWIASGSSDKTIRVWDVKTGRPVWRPFEGHGSEVNSVAFSPDGQWIASGSGDHTVRVWGMDSGEGVCEPFLGHASVILSVAFAPDGGSIASGSHDNTIRTWSRN